jgi:hypothetical protein
MKKFAVILLVTIILASLFGCSSSNIRYEYQGDYKNDPNLQQDVDRDRHKY